MLSRGLLHSLSLNTEKSFIFWGDILRSSQVSQGLAFFTKFFNDISLLDKHVPVSPWAGSTSVRRVKSVSTLIREKRILICKTTQSKRDGPWLCSCFCVMSPVSELEELLKNAIKAIQVCQSLFINLFLHLLWSCPSPWGPWREDETTCKFSDVRISGFGRVGCFWEKSLITVECCC